jgi:antitoxin HigA-1
MLPKNRQPAHPGKILKNYYLEPLNITQKKFVQHLSGTWTEAKLCEIIKKRRSVTTEIALDFADALNTTPEFWMNLQSQHDIWEASKDHEKIQPIIILDPKGNNNTHGYFYETNSEITGNEFDFVEEG